MVEKLFVVGFACFKREDKALSMLIVSVAGKAQDLMIHNGG